MPSRFRFHFSSLPLPFHATLAAAASRRFRCRHKAIFSRTPIRLHAFPRQMPPIFAAFAADAAPLRNAARTPSAPLIFSLFFCSPRRISPLYH
jgi:hypothetical protein